MLSWRISILHGKGVNRSTSNLVPCQVAFDATFKNSSNQRGLIGMHQSSSLHLSPGAKMAHRASICAFHGFLSCAAVHTSLQDCHPALDLSFSTVRRQVVFGRPLFLLPSRVHVKSVTQSWSGCCLRMCPMNSHLLLLTPSINFSTLALSSRSLLLILSCHLIFIILLRHRF